MLVKRGRISRRVRRGGEAGDGGCVGWLEKCSGGSFREARNAITSITRIQTGVDIER